MIELEAEAVYTPRGHHGNPSNADSGSSWDLRHHLFIFKKKREEPALYSDLVSCLSMFHYRKPTLCRVQEVLPSVFYRALSKDGFAECFFRHSAKMYFAECHFSALGKMRLCRVPFFWHSAKMHFAEYHFLALGKMRLCRVPFFGTRQRGILPCAFFFALGKLFFQSNFWGPKWIQMKKISTTKLYNFSRSTKFILVISSFDKTTITLFIKSTSLSYLSY